MSVKVHVTPLPNKKERTLRASSDLLLLRSPPDLVGTFQGRKPMPLAYEKSFPPFCVFSQIRR